MKNKSNLMKILIIISLILITSLIVLVLFLYKELKMVKVDINKTRVITKNYDINNESEEYSNLKNIDEDIDYKWYTLPWGALYGIKNEVISISNLENRFVYESLNLPSRLCASSTTIMLFNGLNIPGSPLSF